MLVIIVISFQHAIVDGTLFLRQDWCVTANDIGSNTCTSADGGVGRGTDTMGLLVRRLIGKDIHCPSKERWLFNERRDGWVCDGGMGWRGCDRTSGFKNHRLS